MGQKTARLQDCKTMFSQKRAPSRALIYINLILPLSPAPCALRSVPLPKRLIPERTLEWLTVFLITPEWWWWRINRSTHHNQRDTVIKLNTVYFRLYILFFRDHFLLREFNFNQLKFTKHVTNVSFYLKLSN